MTLDTLIARLEAATGADHEIDAHLLNLAIGPKGGFVEQSPFNGAWCIYTEERGKKRIWSANLGGKDDFTESLDAIVSLIERALPEREWWRVSCHKEGVGVARISMGDKPILGEGKSPALALCAAFARVAKAKSAPSAAPSVEG